jgi:peptidoglycan/LPS O-acetylase OafA/YrhL
LLSSDLFSERRAATATKSPRYEALDGLRGIAALAIVFYHIRWPNHLTHFIVVKNGYLFVDLFFMISGFVLAASYLDKIRSQSDVRYFLRLRFFRIYPLHFVMLTALVALEFVKLIGIWTGLMFPDHQPFTEPNSVTDLFLNYALFQSFGIIDHPSWNVPSWSISSEAACYVVFAFATLCGITRSRAFELIALPVAIACYGFILIQKGNLYATNDLGFVRGLAGVTLGIWAYHLTRTTNISSIIPSTLSIIALGLAVLIFVTLYFAHGVTDAAVIPAFLLAILFLHQDAGIGAKILSSRFVRALGRISYSIYMVHFLILVCVNIVLKRAIQPNERWVDAEGTHFLFSSWFGDVLVIAVVALVLCTSALLFKWIEQPWREFGRMRRGVNLAQSSDHRSLIG